VDDRGLADHAPDRAVAAREDGDGLQHGRRLDHAGPRAVPVPHRLERLDDGALVVAVEHPDVAGRVEQRIAAAGPLLEPAPQVRGAARDLRQVGGQLHAAHATDVPGRVARAGVARLDHGDVAAAPAQLDREDEPGDAAAHDHATHGRRAPPA
jgi:hypothetical protein